MELWTEQIRQAHAGDKDARNRLVAENLGLVHAVTRRFEHRGHDREELFQIGCIGLMKAIDKFDVSLQLAFSTYAVPMITGEIRRFLRDDGMVKVEELAEAAGLEHEEIVLALEANREVASIYQPVYERDGEELLLIDQMEGSGGQSAEREEPEKEAVLNHILVEQLLETVGERERRLLQLRYYEGKTQCEVAELLSMSQVQVSRLEKKLLLQLRERVRM